MKSHIAGGDWGDDSSKEDRCNEVSLSRTSVKAGVLWVIGGDNGG